MAKNKTVKRITEESEAEDAIQVSDISPKTKIVNKGGIVMIEEVKTEGDEMQEVSYEEWNKEQANHLPKNKLKDKVAAFLGKGVKEVQLALEEMMNSKELNSFRIVPPGAVYTQDEIDGRVQVFVDAKSNVIDIKVG